MQSQAGSDAAGHLLITHYDPDRPDWCDARCSCGRWNFEARAEPDPATHLMAASIKAEREWHRHCPGRD